MSRFRALPIGVLIALCGLLPLASAAHADSQLAVATFEDEHPEQPGTTVTRSLRVSNLSDQQIAVRVEPRGVDLLDDGQTRFRDGEDSLWSGTIQISQPRLDLPGRSYREVTLQIRVPAAIAPDEYMLGLVVSPVPQGDGTRVINEIGVLVPLTVAGDRARKLELVDHAAPTLVFGDSVSGTVRVKNTGTGLVDGWVQADVLDGFSGDHRDQVQLQTRSRVAPGTTRALTYTWNAGITIGKFRVPVRVGFNSDNTTVADVEVEEEVWLIHPLFVGAAIATLALGALLILRTWRARVGGRTEPAGLPEPARS